MSSLPSKAPTSGVSRLLVCGGDWAFFQTCVVVVVRVEKSTSMERKSAVAVLAVAVCVPTWRCE